MKNLQAISGTIMILATLAGSEAAAQDPRRAFGLQAGAAVAASPMSGIAEDFGTFAVPGLELEVRAFTASARGRVWTLGVLADQYTLDHAAGAGVRTIFDYESFAIVIGHQHGPASGSAGLAWGMEGGWRHFAVESARRDHYTDEPATSRAAGNAALVAVSVGMARAGERSSIEPRLRVESSFPSFGGGTGHAALHRTSDVEVRASIGVHVRTTLLRR